MCMLRWSATEWKHRLPGHCICSGYTLDDGIFHPSDERADITALISARGCVTTCEVGWNVKLAEPDKCRTDAWYLLTTERNVDTRGLTENSPRHSFSYACTHGLPSVRTEELWSDWTMYGLKCLNATAIVIASISHGNHVTPRPPSLALTKPASFSLPFCMAYIVAATPHSFTDRSTAHLPVV